MTGAPVVYPPRAVQNRCAAGRWLGGHRTRSGRALHAARVREELGFIVGVFARSRGESRLAEREAPSWLALVNCGSTGICPISGTAAPTARDNRSDTARRRTRRPPSGVPSRPFGDRVTAAKAVVVHRDAGRRGVSMTATAMAKRIAADTPAVRANDTGVPLTGRQREIIALTLAAPA